MADEDVFDVAHNNLMRSAAELPITSRRQIVNAVDWEESKQSPSRTAAGGATSTALVRNDDEANSIRTKVQDAVQATWDKANALQEIAIKDAVSSALREARELAAREKSAALKAQDDELRLEAEKANRRLWEIAAREKEVAVAKALEDQAEELKRLKRELEQQTERSAVDLEDAYHSMKGEVGRVLEEQHSVNVNMAVQAAWESAARLEETAVATARREARAAADSEWEKRLALERLERGEEMRKSVAEAVKANADDLESAKEEARRLRQETERLRHELETERLAAREAEAAAAKTQQAAVNEAVKAFEAVAKSSQDRAVERAVARALREAAGASAAASPVT